MCLLVTGGEEAMIKELGIGPYLCNDKGIRRLSQGLQLGIGQLVFSTAFGSI